jgi:ribosomal protein L37E
MKHHCPKCQRILYNRRLKRCGFCGAPIPEELRFTPEETAALERKAAELEAGRKQKQLAQEATPVVQPSDSVIIPIIIP